MMRPYLRSIIAGSAARVHSIVPVTLVTNMRSYAATGVSAEGAAVHDAALFTRTSSGRNARARRRSSRAPRVRCPRRPSRRARGGPPSPASSRPRPLPTRRRCSDDDVAALGAERQSDRAAEAAAAARHQRHAPVESSITSEARTARSSLGLQHGAHHLVGRRALERSAASRTFGSSARSPAVLRNADGSAPSTQCTARSMSACASAAVPRRVAALRGGPRPRAIDLITCTATLRSPQTPAPPRTPRDSAHPAP